MYDIETGPELNHVVFAWALAAFAVAQCAGAASPTLAEVVSKDPPADARVSVSVLLKRGTDLDKLGESITLFLTAKPATYNITYASAKEQVLPGDFPATYVLGDESNIVVAAEQYQELESILAGSDIVVSGRLDRDGDPATRDPEDLVGRALAAWDPVCGCRKEATVVLQGRGAFGKFVTNRK